MKKNTLTLLFLFLSAVVFSQTVIEKPEIGFSTAPNVHITKIELTDTATLMYFHTVLPSGMWIFIPDKTYIQPESGNKKLFIKAADGIPLGKAFCIPESGEADYHFTFPAIDKTVNKFDYGEANDGGSWFIYNIVVHPKPHVSVLSKELHGNWYNMKTGKWEVSFFDTLAVYRKHLWRYGDVTKKHGLTAIKLTNEEKTTELFMKKNKNGTICMGISPDSLNTYSRNIMNVEKNNTTDEKPFVPPVFKMDTATYSGYFKGYEPRMGAKTFTIGVNDILTAKTDKFLVDLNADGYFSVRFPLYYPHLVFIRASFYTGSVFLEPGKELFQMIDPSNDENSSLFMGQPTKVNSELSLLNKINSFDYNAMEHVILDMTPSMYKEYCRKLEKKDLNSLDSITKKDNIGAKACQVKKLDIIYKYAANMMEYRWYFVNAYRKKHNIPLTQRTIPVKIDSLTESYYDFLTNRMVNDPVAPLSSNYYSFINRLMYMDLLRRTLSQTDQIHSETRTVELQKKLGIHPGIATDIMTAQDNSRKIVEEMTPVSDSELKNIQHEIKTPFIAGYLALCNEKTKAKIEANKQKTGYTINSVPKTKADLVFDSIIQRYRGKIVYVDFWATWCGPCRTGIEQIKPLEEEMKGKNVVFVYITNQTSPEKTWLNMIPDIKGEHYRLSDDEWNYLSARFNISGIPHHVLVGKNGEVINPSFPSMNNQSLRNEMEKYMNE